MKKITVIILSIAAVAVLQNCSNSKKAGKTKMAVTYSNDVMPIMQASCTPCHFPPGGNKKPLNTYDAVKTNIGDIIARVKLPPSDNHFMPWKSKKPALSDSLINVLEEWQKQNTPQ